MDMAPGTHYFFSFFYLFVDAIAVVFTISTAEIAE